MRWQMCVRACMRACVCAALLTNKRRGVAGEPPSPWGRTVGGPPLPSVVVCLLCRYVLRACMRVYSVRLVLAGAPVTSLSKSAVWQASPSAVVYWSSWWVLLGSQCAWQRMSGGCNIVGSVVMRRLVTSDVASSGRLYTQTVRNLAKCSYCYIMQKLLFLWTPLPCLHSSPPLPSPPQLLFLKNHPTFKV